VQHPWGHFFVGNNWFKNYPQHVLEMTESEGTTFSVVYKYNLIWNGRVLPAHLNYLQFGGGHATSVDVEYNTGYQTNLSGGETFQFYDYAGGSIDSSTFACNIIIARGGAQGSHLGYLIHGGYNPVYSSSNPGIAHDNYFDASASWGAFYNGSFNGWTITNNYDMVTGKIINVDNSEVSARGPQAPGIASFSPDSGSVGDLYLKMYGVAPSAIELNILRFGISV
jgi:hypothetical protein